MVLINATEPHELRAVGDRLQGATPVVGAIALVGDELRMPLDIPDPEHVKFGRSLIGYPLADMPVVRGYLKLRRVTSYHTDSAAADSGGARIRYDQSAGSLTVSFVSGANLIAQVDALDLSVELTDEVTGQEPLFMCT